MPVHHLCDRCFQLINTACNALKVTGSIFGGTPLIGCMHVNFPQSAILQSDQPNILVWFDLQMVFSSFEENGLEISR